MLLYSVYIDDVTILLRQCYGSFNIYLQISQIDEKLVGLKRSILYKPVKIRVNAAFSIFMK